MVTTEKAFFPYDLEEESELAFYNYLQKYSAMAGTLYYSRTDQRGHKSWCWRAIVWIPPISNGEKRRTGGQELHVLML
jgi:hypothetical protein